MCGSVSDDAATSFVQNYKCVDYCLAARILVSLTFAINYITNQKKQTMMKKFTKRMFMMAAAFMMCVAGAWAQTATTVYHRALNADGGATVWSDADKDGVSAESWLGDTTNITISEAGFELRVDGKSQKEVTKTISHSGEEG